jgi:3-hydroxybutyryl-CoA dehydrogenase
MTTRPIVHDALVAVVGAGTMGAGIAQVAARAGQYVLLYDARPGAADRAIDVAHQQWTTLVERGKLTETQRTEAQARLKSTKNLGDVKEAHLVIEAVSENLDGKRALFKELESIVAADAILASNTSSFSITAIASGAAHPARFVGMHFFNPAPILPLVEIVSGLATAPAAASRAYATARAWGKTPVHARSTPGFIVNRVARPFYAEAWKLLQVEAVSPGTLDGLMVEAGGFKMGPCALMDLIGHDVNDDVSRSVFAAYDFDRRYQPSLQQRELVAAGHLGRKSGRGFFVYGASPEAPEIDTEDTANVPAPPMLRAIGKSNPLAALAERFSQNGIQIERDVLTSGWSGFAVGDVHLVLCDGRSASQIAFETGNPNTIVFDLALDFSKAQRVGISRASACSDHAYGTVLAAFQKSGMAVSRVGDVPGLPVARTVAMLVNEACDAVFQTVCSMADCDTAMKMGVSYPLGPFEWGQQIGVDYVITLLRNLHHVYGEERYRVSPLLQHKRWTGKAFYA